MPSLLSNGCATGTATRPFDSNAGTFCRISPGYPFAGRQGAAATCLSAQNTWPSNRLSDPSSDALRHIMTSHGMQHDAPRLWMMQALFCPIRVYRTVRRSVQNWRSLFGCYVTRCVLNGRLRRMSGRFRAEQLQAGLGEFVDVAPPDLPFVFPRPFSGWG